jgi:hypothetical protein
LLWRGQTVFARSAAAWSRRTDERSQFPCTCWLKLLLLKVHRTQNIQFLKLLEVRNTS